LHGQTVSIDLTGFRFTRNEANEGIEYEFLANDSMRTLAPGQFVVIAGNREAVLSAHPNLTADLLADRQFSGQLSNGGETLTLTGALGDTIQQFTYDDRWYAETDGRGRSLVIVDQNADLAHWNRQSGWRASDADGGSPGVVDPVAGDVNGDGLVNQHDAVAVFVGFPKTSEARPSPRSFNSLSGTSHRDLIAILQQEDVLNALKGTQNG